MDFALNEHNQVIAAQPGLIGFCPICKEKLTPKCGSLRIWHWSHKKRDCDSWSEPETEWHRDWKNRFPKEWREITVKNHRADVLIPNGKIIEFQNSPLSIEKIKEREVFYGSPLLWILNGDRFQLEQKRFQNGSLGLRWLWPWKSWEFADRPLYFHFEVGDTLIEITWNSPGMKYLAYKTINANEFVRNLHLDAYSWSAEKDKDHVLLDIFILTEMLISMNVPGDLIKKELYRWYQEEIDSMNLTQLRKVQLALVNWNKELIVPWNKFKNGVFKYKKEKLTIKSDPIVFPHGKCCVDSACGKKIQCKELCLP